MKIEVKKTEQNLYNLTINDELVLSNELKLGNIVNKIEGFLKVYFLKEEKANSVGDKLKGMLGG